MACPSPFDAIDEARRIAASIAKLPERAYQLRGPERRPHGRLLTILMEETAMWRILLALLIAAGSATAAGAQSNYRCPGFEPHPPAGCSGPPRCLCDADGNCRWFFDCSKG
jgi:hypothetical protein